MLSGTLDKESQDRLLTEVMEAVEKADITPRQKRVTLRRLKLSPNYRNAFLDEVLAQGFANGFVLFTMDSGDTPVEMQVDWDGLIDFIGRLIPLIIQLIGLFG